MKIQKKSVLIEPFCYGVEFTKQQKIKQKNCPMERQNLFENPRINENWPIRYFCFVVLLTNKSIKMAILFLFIDLLILKHTT